MQLFLNNWGLKLILFETMKKQLFILALALGIGSFSYSQEIDERLTKKYSRTELNQMIQDKPDQYKMLVYALDNACYVIESPNGKEVDIEGEVEVDLTKSLNYIDLGLDLVKDRGQFYKIKGSSKLLVVKSEIVLNLESKSKK